MTRTDAEPLGGYADTVGYNLDTVDCGGDFTTVREADGSNTSTYTCKGGYDDIATMKYAESPEGHTAMMDCSSDRDGCGANSKAVVETGSVNTRGT